VSPQSKTFGLAAGLIVALCVATAIGQSARDTVDAHVAAAKAAAGQNHTGLFNAVCAAATTQPAAAPQRGQPAGGRGQQAGPPDRSQWYAEPVKVFDNLYFVGQTEWSAWAVTTSAGIIVIDTIFEYAVEEEVAGGLKKLGLDPAQIKYVIVSHGHRDHSGGAKFLQDRFNARVIMSAADWDLLDRNTTDPAKPRRDMVATDGQKLTLGDTTLTLYITPGHTAGTISTLIPVKDNGQPHVVAEWGGTLFGNATQRTADNLKTYIASAERFQDIVAKAGADVIISNHTIYDGSKSKLPALASRRPGEPHPYVIGRDATRAYLTVAEECAKAALASISGG
jgi:metallo-beta-lactamase class B